MLAEIHLALFIFSCLFPFSFLIVFTNDICTFIQYVSNHVGYLNNCFIRFKKKFRSLKPVAL